MSGLMRSFSPIGARRAALGAFAIVAFLITVSFGISYGAGALAWLTAVMTGTLACLGVLRAGNPRWMYVSRPRYGTRALSRPDPRLVAAIAGLGSLSLLHAVLSNAWQVTWWAIICGCLVGYTISPPARPADLD
jgi:hypothetical protein